MGEEEERLLKIFDAIPKILSLLVIFSFIPILIRTFTAITPGRRETTAITTLEDLTDFLTENVEYSLIYPLLLTVQDVLTDYLSETINVTLWLDGWNYRKSSTVEGSTSGSVTDYQIKVIVHYGSGTDSGGHVYLNGKCRADFGDVRFTDSDGVTLLPYWIEEKVDGDYAVIWVKIPYIFMYPDTRLFYIYYGKSDATSISNGFNTFPLYDDFEDGTLNTDIWEYQIGAGGQITEANGMLTLTKTTSGAFTYIRNKTPLEGRYLYVLTLVMPVITVPERQRVIMLSSTNNPINPFDIGMFGDSYSQWYIFWGANTNVWYGFNRLFYLHIKCSPSRVDYTWIRDDGSILYSNYCTPTAAPVKIRIGVGDSDTRRGNIFVCNIYARKWIDPEPSIISWGSEESL